MKKEQVIVERTFSTPVAKVWSALTDPKELKEWYFQLTDFITKVGFKFDFTGGPEDGPNYLHLCEITEVIENQKLAYTWRYDNYPGNSLVSWELIDKGEATLVRLSHTGLETFAEIGKDFTKESFTGGWTYFMHTALKNYLEPII